MVLSSVYKEVHALGYGRVAYQMVMDIVGLKLPESPNTTDS